MPHQKWKFPEEKIRFHSFSCLGKMKVFFIFHNMLIKTGHSRDPSHSSVNAGILTLWATRKLKTQLICVSRLNFVCTVVKINAYRSCYTKFQKEMKSSHNPYLGVLIYLLKVVILSLKWMCSCSLVIIDKYIFYLCY